MDLRLFSKLQVADTATLILRSKPGGLLDYYIIAQTVGYSVVCAGECIGDIETSMRSFNMRLSSIVPMIEKGYKFTIQYKNQTLCFVTEDERIRVTPLFVESHDANAADVVQEYIDFYKAREKQTRAQERRDQLQEEIRTYKGTRDGLLTMHLSGPPSEDPFTPDEVPAKIENKYDALIEEREQQLAEVERDVSGVAEVDLSLFTGIANVASKLHTVIDFCESYAVVALKNAYLFQKAECFNLALQGQLLSNLIRDGGGRGFFLFNHKLVYTKGVKESTTVFITKYLPNSEVDSSIITRGVVQEKYGLKLNSILSLASVVRSKFPKLVLELGEGRFVLSNESGESIVSEFEIEDAKTIQLNKMMRGVPVKGEVKMSSIEIPKEVQGVLPLFKEKLTIYIKSNKIVFQSNSLYLVFGR